MEIIAARETAKEQSDYELERGKPIPSFIHGITQMRIGSVLSRLDDFVVGSEIARFEIQSNARYSHFQKPQSRFSTR